MSRVPDAGPRPAATVLLVEDEDAVRRLSERILMRQGYHVILAGSGEAAIEVASTHEGEIDAVITDVVLPNMTGTELIQRLRRFQPHLGVVYMSDYAREDALIGEHVDDDAAFLAKPFSPLALVDKLRDVLNGRAEQPR